MRGENVKLRLKQRLEWKGRKIDAGVPAESRDQMRAFRVMCERVYGKNAISARVEELKKGPKPPSKFLDSSLSTIYAVRLCI